MDGLALPINPVVVGGSASVHTPAPGQMNVQQGTQRAVIAWDSFNIGTNAQVRFVQPNSQAIAVNRVTGNDAQPTQILGRLRGNGRIVVLDTNGVMFGPDSRVDAAGLLASTGNIDTAAFMADTQDRIALTQAGDIGARVENHGQITVAQSGLAALVAPHVVNHGVITANLGRVVLAGAETATLDLYGDGLFAITAPAATQGMSVTQAGTVTANGGTIHLTTQDTQAALANVINLGGVTRAQTVNARPGVISLRTGQNGRVRVTGVAVADGDLTLHADRDIELAADNALVPPQLRSNQSGTMTITTARGQLMTHGLTDVFGKYNAGDVRVTLGGGGNLADALAAIGNFGSGQTEFMLGAAQFSGDATVTGNNVTLRSLAPDAPAVIAGQNYALRLLGDNISLQDLRLESQGDGLLVGDGARDFSRATLSNVAVAAQNVGVFIQNAEVAGLDTLRVQGGDYGLILDGAAARVAQDNLAGLHLIGQTQDYIRLQNGAMAGQRLLARDVTIGNNNKAQGVLVTGHSLSDADYNFLADRIVDGLDFAGLGLVDLGRSAPKVVVPIDYTQRVDVRHYVPGTARAPVFAVGAGREDVPRLAAAIGTALNALSPGAGSEDEEDDDAVVQSSF